MDDGERRGITASLLELATELDGAPAAEQSPLLLVLDQGGHASRALVFDATGRQVAQAFAPIDTQRYGSDRIEHDPTEIVASLRTVVHDVAQNLGRDVDRIVAAGLATQRSSIVCWDATNGTPLSPVLSWQDRRNNTLVETLHTERARIQRLTGLVLSPHYGASKLRWCLDQLPAVQDALNRGVLRAGPLAAFVLHALLKERPLAVDPANASRTQLWDPAMRDWAPELLEWFGVPRSILPECVPTRHAYGVLAVGAHEVPLSICTGDQAAAPFADGALRNDTLYMNVGTGAFLLAPSEHDVGDAAPYLRSVLWSDGERVMYALEGTVNGAGSALDWLNERIGIDTHRAARSMTREHVAGVVLPLFINGISGVGSPYWLSQLESQFIGDGDEVAQVAAVLESIAFLAAANIAGLRQRAPIESIAIGGGLAQSNYLCECLADLSGLPVRRSGERELTAKGLAYLVAGQPTNWRASVRVFSFTPQSNPELMQRYGRWRELMLKYAG